VCWCLSHRLDWKTNRELLGRARGEYVRKLCSRKVAPGVLAYCDAEVAGWAAVAPRSELPFARSAKIPHVDDLPVWSVWCIRVRPGFRGRGISHALLDGAVAYARSQGAALIEFGGEDGSRADPEYVKRIHLEGLGAGGARPSTPDTVGCYSPYAVRDYISQIKSAAPHAPLVVHFHNDLGLGAWNTVVALGSGAEVFTTSVNGIGERTGNAPMHQVLLQLRYLFGIEIPGFRYERLRDLARLMERLSGIPVAPTEPGIGLNVFSHESGIHTAGMLIHPEIYQFIPPSDLGAEIRYVYGKHSGAMVIENALRQAGIPLEAGLVARVMEEVKRLREERAERSDFSDFQREYYDHLEGMGVTAEEVAGIARALHADAGER